MIRLLAFCVLALIFAGCAPIDEIDGPLDAIPAPGFGSFLTRPGHVWEAPERFIVFRDEYGRFTYATFQQGGIFGELAAPLEKFGTAASNFATVAPVLIP